MNARIQFNYQNSEARDSFRSSTNQVPMTTDLAIPNYRGVYSKGFSHDNHVTPDAVNFARFVTGIQKRDIGLINSVSNIYKKLVDVNTLVDKELIGKFKTSYRIDLPPSPISEQGASELLELYGMALLRDIPFHQWETQSQDPDSLFSKVLQDLNQVKVALKAPVASSLNNNITHQTLFRGNCPLDIVGPHVSQFLYHPIQLGSLWFEQKYECPSDLKNFMTDVSGFLHIWNGGNPNIPIVLKGPTRYLITIRDCANYIHLDQLWQPFFMTANWLLDKKIPVGYTCPQRTGGKFISLGPVDLFDLLMHATKLAMNSAWIWKWNQLKMRPEEMAYQLHLKRTTSQGLNFHSILTENRPILQHIFDLSQNYLLPQAYPEGSPSHPSYPAGHAVVAGAMSTIIKAWFADGDFPNPKIPNQDGSVLEDWTGVRLTIWGELDKMASNCSVFRNFGGIHYRSDMNGGLLLGEMIAIDVLQDFVLRYSNQVKFNLKKRNGQFIEIRNF